MINLKTWIYFSFIYKMQMESFEDQSPSMARQTSELSEHSESDIKDLNQMYLHKIVTSPSSPFTLEHRRQTPEEKKLIYCVRFDPEDNKYLAIGEAVVTGRVF